MIKKLIAEYIQKNMELSLRKIILCFCIVFFTVNLAFSLSVETEILNLAKKEYPTDYSMQQYIYKKQMDAYRYMLSVADQEVKSIALKEYPNDYSMQKYI